jgi:hypothetical protein
VGLQAGDAVSQLLRSPEYSSVLNIVLPPSAADDPTNSTSPAVSYIIAAKSSTPSPDHGYLPQLPPLFAPAPFTPSHPVFVHLAQAAGIEAARLRNDAEEEVADVVRRKLLELERRDGELRRQVHSLWHVFATRVAALRGGESLRSPALTQRRDSNGWSVSRTNASSPTLVGPQSTRNFVPIDTPPQRPATAPASPRASALATSLRTSGMHHPAEAQSQPRQSNVDASVPVRVGGWRSGATDEGQAIILEAYRRKMNDDPNISASMLVRSTLHAQMESSEDTDRQRQKKARRSVDLAEGATQPEPQPAEAEAGGDVPTIWKGKDKDVDSSAATTVSGTPSSPPRSALKDSVSKGKRKVTFDVQPAVVTIDPNALPENENAALSPEPNFEEPNTGTFLLQSSTIY